MTGRILIVDDEPNIVLSLEFLMRSHDFEVRSADSGETALSMLADFRPDLVLLDVMLPHPGGFEVCRRIRADPALAGTRVVFLSARDRAIEQERGRALGADAYLTKPFSTRELIETVRALMP